MREEGSADNKAWIGLDSVIWSGKDLITDYHVKLHWACILSSTQYKNSDFRRG